MWAKAYKEAYNIRYVKRTTFPVTGSKAQGNKPNGKSSSTQRISQDSRGVEGKKSVSGTRITDSTYKEIEEHFGVTKNFDVAGYLLLDGKMLDYSGKHPDLF